MNLFELFVKIGVKDEASKNIGSISSKLGKGLQTAAKIGTAAVSAASAGIVALTKEAVQSYAEYEQLIGGAELMFGKAFDTVMKNSQNAYKTVQLSQNEYLKQVNGFATGLKTALGGNEQAAADLSHRIVQAEADIIAATGNTAENVQNAFNGIMKSNFTMVDNLQIGITPTKEGFQEVIDKVNEWNTANGKATKYQMGNLADMQSALVDYIDMVGMSGYAQREASQTIEGSLASMKGAWSNLLTGIADDTADFDTLIENLVDSVATFSDNILPRVEIALSGASRLVSELLPEIVERIPQIIENTLPDIVSAAVKIVESIMTGVSENQESLFTTIFDLVVYLVNSFISMLPQIVQLGLDLIVSLATGVSDSLPELMPTIVSVILEIVRILTSPENLSKILQAALTIVIELANGLMDAIPELVGATIDIITSLVDFLLDPENISLLLSAALEIVLSIGSGLISSIPQLVKSVGKLILSIKDTFKQTDWKAVGGNLVAGFKKGIENAWGNLKKWFTGLFGDLTDIAKKILGIASPSKVFKKIGGFTIEGLEEGLEENADEPIRTIEDISSQLTNAFDPSLSADYITSYDGYGSSSYGGSSSAYSNEEASSSVNITFGEKAFYIANFNGNSESEVDNFVDAVIDKLTSKIQSREAVFA